MKHAKLIQNPLKFAILAMLAALAVGLAGCGAAAARPTASTTKATMTAAPTAQTSVASASGQTAGSTGTISQKLTAEAGKAFLTRTPGAILLDVRTPAEHKDLRIPGSILIPVDELPDRLSELPKDPARPIVVYCRSGNRSATAAAILVKAGFPAVYDMGGINSWPYETEKG